MQVGVGVRKFFVWVGRTLLILFALFELFAAAISPMPNALGPLAIGGGILFWQGIRLNRYFRDQKSDAP